MSLYELTRNFEGKILQKFDIKSGILAHLSLGSPSVEDLQYRSVKCCNTRLNPIGSGEIWNGSVILNVL